MSKAVDGYEYWSATAWERLLQGIPASYVVWPDTATSVYRGECNVAGRLDVSDASSSVAINAALSNVTQTRLERVALKGNFTIDGTLNLGPYTILDLREATLTATNALDSDIIEANGWHWSILGGHIEGNKGNQSSGSGIRIGGTTETQRFFVGDGMILHDAKDYGIHIEGAVGKLVGVGSFHHIDIEDCGNHGIFGSSYASDCQFNNINVGGCACGILFAGGFNANTVTGCQVWNCTEDGIRLDAADANVIAGNRVDYNAYNGIALTDGANWNTVSSNNVYNNSYGYALNYDGIVINDSIGNHITCNRVYNYPAASASYQEYGIKEKNDDSLPEASDYNVIKGNECYGNHLIGYSAIVGANTAVDNTITSTNIDLSGAATTLHIFNPHRRAVMAHARIIYTEASSGDAGITLEVGKLTDRNYYYTGTSAVSAGYGYIDNLTLLQTEIPASECVTFYSPGGKAGAGEVALSIDYLENA